jgi:hypothetical protein
LSELTSGEPVLPLAAAMLLSKFLMVSAVLPITKQYVEDLSLPSMLVYLRAAVSSTIGISASRIRQSVCDESSSALAAVTHRRVDAVIVEWRRLPYRQ